MDVTLKNINNLTEKEVVEWVAILVKRKAEQQIIPAPQAVIASRETIDSYRVANGLKAEFAKEVVEEVVEEKPIEEPIKEEEVLPKDVPQG